MQILYSCFVNILYFLLEFSNPSSISPELYSGYIVHCPAIPSPFSFFLSAGFNLAIFVCSFPGIQCRLYFVHCPAYHAGFFFVLQANLIRRSIKKNKRALLEHPPASFIIPSLGKLCFSMYQNCLNFRQNWYMLIHESPT